MLLTNFAAGELSPTLNGRVDIQQYYQGASRLENFDVIPTGGIKRRQGMKRLLELDADCRIIPFIVDGSNIFILAVWAGNTKVYKLNFTSAGIETVYKSNIDNSYESLSEVREVQYAQTYDTLVMVHRSRAPLWFKFSNGTVVAATMTPDFYPDSVISDPDEQIMLVKSDAAAPVYHVVGYNVPYLGFDYTDVNGVSQYKAYAEGATAYYLRNGILYKYVFGGTGWEQTSSDVIDNTLFKSVNNYPGCVTFFNNRLIFASTNTKQQKIWASMAPDTDDTRYNKFATYKKYITVSKVVKDGDMHNFSGDIKLEDITSTRVKITNIQGLYATEISSDSYIKCDLFPIGVRITSRTSNTITVALSGFTLEEAVTNISFTSCLWKDPENLTAEDYEYKIAEQNVTTADCSFNFELASDQNDAIKFVSSNRFMAIATESTFWAMAAGCTALNIQVENQGRYGSDDIQGLSIAQATVYFAQGKKGIREFYYDNESQAFQTNNIAIHAQHLLQESPVIDFDYCNNPYNRLVLTRNDGTVASLMYDKTNGVMAWSRITRNVGKIRSVAITRGFDDTDYTFFVIKDNDHFYLELLGDDYRGEGAVKEEVFLDSWKPYTSAVTGYTDDAILWNKTQDKTCSKTSIPDDFITTGDVVYIGYKYKSYIKSMPCIASDPNGRKRITNLIVRYLDSYMPTLKVTGVADEHFTTIVNLPYSGVANITYPGQTNRDVYFELEADDVKPVNILAVNALLA